MKNRYETNYEFYNPSDLSAILFQVIKKIGKYRWNEKKKKEERIEWEYRSADFTINPALIFSKLIPYARRNDESENKDKSLGLIINEINKLIKDEKILEYLEGRNTQLKMMLENNGMRFEEFELMLYWRMVIGLGASHPQETSMTLHHIYGIPYIPGSAIKGVTRHWVIINYFEGDEDKAIQDPNFCEIFGTQENQGKVIFFDAYPVGTINLKIDVMTPHYSDYYSGKEPPADWQSPVPIKFLTVERTKFKFYLASKDKNLLEKASEWLKEALKEHGIGAKTAIGYGYFE